MTIERTIEYLEDIRPTTLRLRQVEYLLSLPLDPDALRAVSYGEKVATYTTSDMTANTVERMLDKAQDLREERDVLEAKLQLYKAWLNEVGEIYRDLVESLYVKGHTADWIAREQGYEKATIYQRKARLIKALSEVEIQATTENEKKLLMERI